MKRIGILFASIAVVCLTIVASTVPFAPSVSAQEDCRKQPLQARERCEKRETDRCKSLGSGDAIENCLQRFRIANGQQATTDPSDPEYRDPALECSAGQDNCDLYKKYINPIIWFLSAAVGLAVTIGIISGGLRYAAAGDDPQKVSAAKQQIRSAIIALLAFLFLFAALQWLIPGGVL